MSQKAHILEHLRSGRELTPLSALHLFGCLRLGARVMELRREGWRIVDVGPVRKAKHAIYTLAQGQAPAAGPLPPWEAKPDGSLFPAGPVRHDHA